MKLKVCGLKEEENIKSVLACEPDLIGFIFYDKSPRFIKELDADFVRNISQSKKVGVFVNESESVILNKVKEYKLDYVQLHGDESPMFCEDIRKHIPVIKAFRIDNDFNFDLLLDYINCCDYFLFDSNTKAYGGSGESFNHKKLEEYNLSKPFFLSGGIDEVILSETEELKKRFPQLFALDVNSRFEISAGIKDTERIKSFSKKLKDETT